MTLIPSSGSTLLQPSDKQSKVAMQIVVFIQEYVLLDFSCQEVSTGQKALLLDLPFPALVLELTYKSSLHHGFVIKLELLLIHKYILWKKT